MAFSFARVLVLLCGLACLCTTAGADAASGSVKGNVANAKTNAAVTMGSVALTINGVPWGATASIDGSGNFDFGTVLWAGSSTVNCQFQTSGTGLIDGGTSGTLSANGSLYSVISLQPGSSISGTIADAATSQLISTGSVLIFDSAGTLLGSAPANAQGAYRYGGLLAGTYYARTDVPDYLDELWNNIVCPKGNCAIRSGTPIQLPNQSSDASADFQLALDLIFIDDFGG